MATHLDPAVRQLTGEVLSLRGQIYTVEQSNARAIRNLNDQASRIEQHAYQTLRDLGDNPRRGLVGTPTESENRFFQFDTVVGLIGQISHAKAEIRAIAKGINIENTLTYDVREGWAHWGVRNFVGKPIKAVAYDVPAAVVKKTGAINAITVTALGAAGVYGYLSGDYQGAAVIAGTSLVGRGVIHLGDRAYHKVMG